MRSQLITKDRNGNTIKRSFSNANSNISQDQIKTCFLAIINNFLDGETGIKVNQTMTAETNLQ